jgi:phage RecT family recombinase
MSEHLPVNSRMIQMGKAVAASLSTKSRQQWVTHLLEYLPSNDKLMACRPESIAAALSQGEARDLTLGVDYYLIPRGNSATFQLGYRGALKLATRGGRSVGVQAQIVTRREVESSAFRVAHHMTPPFEHVQDLDREPGEDIAGAYAVACVDGAWRIEWMSLAQLDAHAAKYGGKSGPWADALARPEMYRKTVLLRLCKTLPLPDDAHRAFAADGEGARDLGTVDERVERERSAARRQVSSGIRAQLEAQQDIIDVGSDSREAVSVEPDPGPGYTEDELPFT